MTNNDDNLYLDEDKTGQDETINAFSLSGTFCALMDRRNEISSVAEFDQIAKITEIDISSIYEMEDYPDEETIDYYLSAAKNDKERQALKKQFEINKIKLTGNIDRVLLTVNNLIDKLNLIENLPALLLPIKRDTLKNNSYFADFQIDKAKEYTENNFGQDLRNLNRFLTLAKKNGIETVWFNYG